MLLCPKVVGGIERFVSVVEQILAFIVGNPQIHRYALVLCQNLLQPLPQEGQVIGVDAVFRIVLQINPGVRSMIRDSKSHQIPAFLDSAEGMQSMDKSILELYRQGKIAAQTALDYVDNPEQMK